MRRLYKIILIVMICIICTIYIFFLTKEQPLTYLAIGDGVASGETPYDINGISFNDYFKENYHIHSSNKSFSFKNNTVEKIINDINKNMKSDGKYLKQLIYEADIITIAVGMDELNMYSLTNDVNEEYIKKFCSDYNELLHILTKLNAKEVIIIGLYNYFTIKESNIIILNSMLSNLADKYDYKFIDISSFLKEDKYFLDKDSYYFSYKGHYKIYQMISNTIISK